MRPVTKCFRQIYTLLFILAIPFVTLRLLLKSRKQPAYRKRIKERFALLPTTTQKPSIWLHTVSVGESLAAIPLVEKILDNYPAYNLHITTTTPTGSEQVLKHFKGKITHSYLPYDIPCFIKRFIRKLNIKCAIIFETEVWPNILAACKHKNIPTLLTNARLSEKSCGGFKRLGPVASDLFNLFTKITAQSDLDAKHYQQLGVDPHRICVTGNIKFNQKISDGVIQSGKTLRNTWKLSNRPILIAASTRDNEEPYILDALTIIKKTYPDLLLILIPRHPDRKNKILPLCSATNFSVITRSQDTPPTADTDIFFVDTIGELPLFYAMSDVTYVGGSLVNMGGHNMLEPAALGLPIITGPYLRNFKAISETLIRANAQLVVNNSAELAATVLILLNNEKERNAMGNHAKAVFEKNQGALSKQMNAIDVLLSQSR